MFAINPPIKDGGVLMVKDSAPPSMEPKGVARSFLIIKFVI